MKKEIEILKAKAGKTGFPAPIITANDLKRAKLEKETVKPIKVYAIMNGARKGIYPTYPEHDDREVVKEFATEFEANYVLNTYLGPQPKRNDYKEAMLSIGQPKSLLQTIGYISQPTALRSITQPIVRKDWSEITEEYLLFTYNLLLEGKTEEGIYPVMKAGLLKVMIYPKVKPQKVYELFCLGLIDTIYLSPKL